MIVETDLAYLAGIMDGEGSIFIAKQKSKLRTNPSYILRLSITSTDKPLCEWIMGKFGGHIIYDKKQSSRGTGYKACYHWRIVGNKAKAILIGIQKYLIIKKEKAELAILFQDQKRGIGSRGITQEQLCSEQSFKEKISNSRCGGHDDSRTSICQQGTGN